MNKEIKTIVLRDVKEIKEKVAEKPEREFQVDLYWKARNFKTFDKTIDWYWFYWTTFALLIFVLIKFTDNRFLWILLILIAILNFLNLKFGQTINEYRINKVNAYFLLYYSPTTKEPICNIPHKAGERILIEKFNLKNDKFVTL